MNFLCPAMLTVALVVSNAVTSLHAQTTVSVPRLNLSKPDWIADEPFSVPPSLRVLSNGSIIAADFHDTEVRLINNFGKTVRQLGRKGSGPAEYTAPSALIALPHDTTLLLDRDARRLLVLDPLGNFVGAHPIPTRLGEGAERLVSADEKGRVYYQFQREAKKGEALPGSAAVARWQRNTDTFDTVAILTVEVPKAKSYKVPKGLELSTVSALRTTTFGPIDNWIAAPSGRVAVIYAVPYHVEWVENNRSKTIGAAVSYVPVPVTARDRKAREPQGPPFVRVYATVKAAFENGTAVLDERENIWVQRSDAAGSATRRWDVFNPKGARLTTLSLPANHFIQAITAKYAYVIRSDTDGLFWLERYSR